MYSPLSANRGTICDGGRLWNSGLLQVARIACRFSSLSLLPGTRFAAATFRRSSKSSFFHPLPEEAQEALVTALADLLLEVLGHENPAPGDEREERDEP
jgi:hypothetical protein